MRRFLTLLFAISFISQASAEKPLQVVSYNVWCGFTKEPERKTAYLEWMKKQSPDVVSLQELNNYTAEKLQADARAWGHKHSAILKENGFPTGITHVIPSKTCNASAKDFTTDY